MPIKKATSVEHAGKRMSEFTHDRLSSSVVYVTWFFLHRVIGQLYLDILTLIRCE